MFHRVYIYTTFSSIAPLKSFQVSSLATVKRHWKAVTVEEADKLTRTWNINSTRLEQRLGPAAHQKETGTHLETDKKENTTYRHRRDAARAVLRAKLTPATPLSFGPRGSGPAGRPACASRGPRRERSGSSSSSDRSVFSQEHRRLLAQLSDKLLHQAFS